MSIRTSRRRLITIGVIAGVAVIVAAIVATQLQPHRDDPGPTATSSPVPSSSASTTPHGDVVDAAVAERGWVPEPISQDPDVYARAALEAAGTFDTRLSDRAEWVEWLGTWFTPSPLYAVEQDALDQMADYRAELDNSVALPQETWDDLAQEDGRVEAHVRGEIEYLELPETTAARMWTATADVTLTYIRIVDGDETSYDESARVSAQVVCGGASVPTSGSGQRAGDCKVVRFFDEAVG